MARGISNDGMDGQAAVSDSSEVDEPIHFDHSDFDDTDRSGNRRDRGDQMAMKNLTILLRSSGEYEDYQTEVVGVTDNKELANAFLQVGAFDPNFTHEIEIVTLNVMQDFPHIMDKIAMWRDPILNPMCECGHRMMHHRSRHGQSGRGSCKHNHTYEPKHQCKVFTFAKEA
jgi:hypothetical protein